MPNGAANVKMDLKDKKLLYHLSTNARESYTQLGKKVALSKNAVKYRVERMKNEGVIKNFASVINLGAIGLDTFTLLLKFNSDIYKDKDIISYFKNHEFADWVVSLSGEWDIFAEFVCRDLNHVSEILEGIIREFNEDLIKYELMFSRDTLRVEHLISDFYKETKLQNIQNKERRVDVEKIDKVDRKILGLLSVDSSLGFPEIADKLNLTIDIVRYRMKNLINKRIIVKFFPEVSLPTLGYTEYLSIISLKNISMERLNSLKKRITGNDNITYSFFDRNSLSLVFVCAFNNSEGIDSLLRGLRGDFRDIIDKQEYLLIKEQILFNLFPKGLVK